MKKKSLKKFSHRRYLPDKDSEGNVIEKYEDKETKDEALIWPATSKIQANMYGLRINDICNMHYYGDINIHKHDMIIYGNNNYKVISSKKYRRFLAMEIEKI